MYVRVCVCIYMYILYIQAVIQIRRLVLVLGDFQNQLKNLPACEPGAHHADAVLKITGEIYERCYAALRTLVVNCSWGENPDPMSRYVWGWARGIEQHNVCERV